MFQDSLGRVGHSVRKTNETKNKMVANRTPLVLQQNPEIVMEQSRANWLSKGDQRLSVQTEPLGVTAIFTGPVFRTVLCGALSRLQ